MDHPSRPQRLARPSVAHDLEARVRPAAPGPDAAADEAAADRARAQLRERGIVPIEPDDRIGALLGPEERVVAMRCSVSLERRMQSREPGRGLCGALYVTTRRLVHLGRVPIEYPLGEIREAFVAEGALRLVVGEDRGIEIAVGDPRLLRVQIAAVREAARAAAARRSPETSPGAASPGGRG